MEATMNFVAIIIIVFGILQIILFFKMWGMTDDIRAIKNKYLNLSENKTTNIAENSKFEYQEKSPNGTIKFQKDDIVIYKPENTKLVVIEYISPNIFKCKTIDGTDKIYCFQEEYLDKINKG